jgi:hypothetical protein
VPILSSPSAKEFSIPVGPSVSIQQQSLDEIATQLGFSIRLQFRGNHLGLAITRGPQTTFLGLDQLV